MAADTAEPPSSPSPPGPPMEIDGSEQDAALAKSEWLSRREVLERRSRRAKQLARVYRQHYWAIMEDLKSKHREYYWTYGKSPFKDHEDNNNNSSSQPLGLGGPTDDLKRCVITGCRLKPMALTNHCHVHILYDTKQKLYQRCKYVIKSMHTGQLSCCKPVMRSSVPLLCPTHLLKGEKCLIRDLRKAGLNISSLNNLAPKFHVLISEYICQIQARRRAAPKTNVCKTEPK